MAARIEEVMIKTPDGVCDAALAHPQAGSWPGVIIFPDALGLRPVVRELASQLAEQGFSVLAVNQFYRSKRPPILPPQFSFQNPQHLAILTELRAPLTAEAVTRDGQAFVTFLDTHPTVNRAARIGTVGYCMGGAMTLRTAAAVADRVGAGASFHGGALVTDKADSPHLLVSRIRAHYYFGVAANDDEREPHAKEVLRDAFAAAHLPAKIEVYPHTLHGWCMPDMPPAPGAKPIYDPAQAERAWGELLRLFKATLR